jgi:hypothetical protein
MRAGLLILCLVGCCTLAANTLTAMAESGMCGVKNTDASIYCWNSLSTGSGSGSSSTVSGGMNCVNIYSCLLTFVYLLRNHFDK